MQPRKAVFFCHIFYSTHGISWNGTSKKPLRTRFGYQIAASEIMCVSSRKCESEQLIGHWNDDQTAHAKIALPSKERIAPSCCRLAETLEVVSKTAVQMCGSREASMLSHSNSFQITCCFAPAVQ